MTSKDDSVKRQEELDQDAPKSGVNRRMFLAAGSAAVAALAFPNRANAASMESPQQISQALAQPRVLKTIAPARSGFVQPEIKNCQTDPINLTVDKITVQLNEQTSVPAWVYDNDFPGPTLCVNPGGEINITFTNNLAGSTITCPTDNANTPNCFDKTNLHFHGLHVSPSSAQNGEASDDVVTVELGTGESKNYRVKLPDYHAPGTHWYHAHRHGSTGIQLSKGMAGALIVKESPAYQIVPDEQDKVWVLQEIVQNVTDDKFYTTGAGRVSGTFLVNGSLQPTIDVNAGQWQRWRFINATATPRGLMNLKLIKCDDCANSFTPPAAPTKISPMYLIAVDGISFYGKKAQSTTTNGWDFAPGNRADFLIWVTEPGEYMVVKDNYTGLENTQLKNTVQVLAYVNVQAATCSPDPDPANYIIPGIPPAYLQPLEAQEVISADGSLRQREIDFQVAGRGTYQMNQGLYDHNSCSSTSNPNCQQVALNTAEVWTLKNLPTTTTTGSPHPFHIHINPFQLVGDKIDPQGPDDSSNWRWWDTIAVDPGKCDKIAHRFTDYNGNYVLHCHILIHEDQGMMQNVAVQGNGTGAGQPLSTCSFQPSSNPTYLTQATCT